jgi:hypothetical protein
MAYPLDNVLLQPMAGQQESPEFGGTEPVEWLQTGILHTVQIGPMLHHDGLGLQWDDLHGKSSDGQKSKISMSTHQILQSQSLSNPVKVVGPVRHTGDLKWMEVPLLECMEGAGWNRLVEGFY